MVWSRRILSLLSLLSALVSTVAGTPAWKSQLPITSENTQAQHFRHIHLNWKKKKKTSRRGKLLFCSYFKCHYVAIVAFSPNACHILWTNGEKPNVLPVLKGQEQWPLLCDEPEAQQQHRSSQPTRHSGLGQLHKREGLPVPFWWSFNMWNTEQ